MTHWGEGLMTHWGGGYKLYHKSVTYSLNGPKSHFLQPEEFWGINT
jgi:hypothetical protein